jgi:hypothetical protein
MRANISSTIIHFKFWFSQSVNDYKAVIVPIKYEFTSTDNQYRLATISKYNLNNAGFEAFMTMSRLKIIRTDVVSCIMISLRKMHF